MTKELIIKKIFPVDETKLRRSSRIKTQQAKS